MKNMMTAKAALLSVFVAAAGCHAQQEDKKAAPSEDDIFQSTFTVQTYDKTAFLNDSHNTVVFDFNKHTMTVRKTYGDVVYTKSTNEPLTKQEANLALFAENVVCSKMNKVEQDKILLDPNVESISYGRGCADNGGIGRVNYKTTNKL